MILAFDMVMRGHFFFGDGKTVTIFIDSDSYFPHLSVPPRTLLLFSPSPLFQPFYTLPIPFFIIILCIFYPLSILTYILVSISLKVVIVLSFELIWLRLAVLDVGILAVWWSNLLRAGVWLTGAVRQQ